MLKKFNKLILIFCLMFACFAVANFVMAEALDVGLEYGEATGLGQEDPRIIAANIIRVLLGFLGILAVSLIIFAGWLWMSAAGNAEKIEQAKKILSGAIIGLIIIFSSFAIASLVLNKLLDVTGGEGGMTGSLTTIDETPAGGTTILPGVGEPCLTSALDVTCAVGECDAGLVCDENCLCQESDAPGEGESCDADMGSEGCQAVECISNLVCSNTDDCLCIKSPLIAWISPLDENNTPNGAPGNFITIGGIYFGPAVGKVIFIGDPENAADDKEAVFPVSINPDCENYWQDDQIIVVVPEGAVSGPIKVVDAGGLWDSTDNDRGPLINDFQINDMARPGLCLANPDNGYFNDSFTLLGASFSGDSQEVLFGSENSYITANNISGWTDISVQAAVPNIKEGSNAVSVRVGGISSNSLRFNVFYDEAANPAIEYIDPAQGPPGQYITIYGRNFGIYSQGLSLVNFYLPADPENLINVDVDFPEECQDSYWHDTYIIIKVPDIEIDNYKVIVTNKDGYTSGPADFAVIDGKPGPGICLLDPHNGPVGQAIYVYGDNFGSDQGSGKTVFYSDAEGLVSNWVKQKIDTNVPSGAQTGPFKVINDNSDVSNSLPFTVGSCSGNEECELGEECCTFDTYWSGICRGEGTCSEGLPLGCGFGWTFSTSVKAKIFNCSGYTTAEACVATDMCPNSPGQCQSRDEVTTGDCSDNYCNSNYSDCSNNCVYDNNLNKCKLLNSSCDEKSVNLIYGYTAECREVGGEGVWQIDMGGVSCPLGSFLGFDDWCIVGTPEDPSECSLCESGFKCESGACTIGSSVCSKDSVCQNGDCVLDNPVCECCCRVGYDSQDCCTGLICEPGDCGPGAPDYGICTGCRVVINGEINQEASDRACNCYGLPTRYCELNDTNYPMGVCLDGAVLGESCYDEQTAATCNSDYPPCIEDFFCDPNDCTCKEGGGVGASCDNNTATSACEANNELCQAGLVCDFDSCTCQPGSSAGGECLLASLPACAQGTSSCLFGYECLDKESEDCRCCCNPSNDQCPEPLECWANKEPCDSTNRGLCCGCSFDVQCSGGVDGCGEDRCCRGRPQVIEPTSPVDGAAGVCRNILVKANFDQPMNTDSFEGNIFLVGDYESDQCPSGTKFLAGDFKKDNVFTKVFKKTLISLGKIFKPVLGKRALALIDQSHNYCAVEGWVSGYNSTGGEGTVVFASSAPLDSNRLYYVVIKGDNNPVDDISQGVLSKYGIGMWGPDTGTFNAQQFINAKIWSFETGSDICQASKVKVDPISYLFQTSENNFSDDDASLSSYDTISDSDKVFRSSVWSSSDQELIPLDGVYDWQWGWDIDDESVVKFKDGGPAPDSNEQVIVAQNKEDDKTNINAQITISEDGVNISSTVGQTISGQAQAYVFMCANPWPPVGEDNLWEPWRDSEDNCSIGLEGSGCLDSNFEFYYCRDLGQLGTADDLPAILSDTVVRGYDSDLELLKEFYFLREDMPSITILSVSDQQTGGKVAASWDSVAGASGYKLYFGVKSGEYDNFFDVGEASSRIITGLTNGQVYYFAVTAYYNTGAESSYSNEVSVVPSDKTAPASIIDLTAIAGDSQVDLSWSSSGEDAILYKIYYGTSSGVYGSSAEISSEDACLSNNCSVTVENLINGATYYFTVTAVDAYGNESGNSNEVSAQPIVL